MNGTEPAPDAVRRTIDREVDLVMSAVELVAAGGAASMMVVGLRLTDAVMVLVSPRARERGVSLEPLWGADEDTADIRVRRMESDR